jgi:hypothetical protein
VIVPPYDSSMPASEFFAKGTNLARFVADNKEQLKDKHLIYIIRSNVNADRFVYKTGKTTAGPSRLTSYVHTHGFQKKGQPQAGARLFFYQVVPSREPGVAGLPLVSRYEKALEMAMALAGAKKAHGWHEQRGMWGMLVSHWCYWLGEGLLVLSTQIVRVETAAKSRRRSTGKFFTSSACPSTMVRMAEILQLGRESLSGSPSGCRSSLVVHGSSTTARTPVAVHGSSPSASL